ncbi:putative disease resistance protein At1g59780 [Morus notabilis]|uniref:putative disease resistance protein At1g59780 n=1 Tax=Morus notabilis TaxID=981085 RepID=UPI000CED2BEF|nr:putative disease resistance protein At1g59780 [Morus notabilis]
MPYHLKPCFLHFAHFPEDHEIKVKQLCYSWIAGKSCRIHDLMRNLSLEKAQEENFMQFADLRNKDNVVANSMSSAAEPIVSHSYKSDQNSMANSKILKPRFNYIQTWMFSS